MTNDELFATFVNLVQRAGGAEALAEALKVEGEYNLAESVLQCAACTTVVEFMALEHMRSEQVPRIQPLYVD